MLRRIFDAGGDGLGEVGFVFGDFEVGDGFAWQGIPKEDFFASLVGCYRLTTRNDFVNLNHGIIISEVRIFCKLEAGVI